MALKRTKHDKIISDLIRERAEWCCERCDTYFPEGHGRQGLHASHYYGRGRISTRFLPDNLNSLCMGCHLHMSGNRDEYTAFKVKELGQSRFDDLVLRGNAVMKYTKSDKEELYIHYKAQYKYMLRRRKQGDRGYLPIVNWD